MRHPSAYLQLLNENRCTGKVEDRAFYCGAPAVVLERHAPDMHPRCARHSKANLAHRAWNRRQRRHEMSSRPLYGPPPPTLADRGIVAHEPPGPERPPRPEPAWAPPSPS